MNEEQALAVWLATELAADAGVSALVSSRIYEAQGPQGATFPYVVFALNRGADTHFSGSNGRAFSRIRYVVRAVTEGNSFARADVIARAVDAALVGRDEVVTVDGQGYHIQVVGRETPVRYPETVEGVRYNHVGGIYFFWVAATLT